MDRIDLIDTVLSRNLYAFSDDLKRLKDYLKIRSNMLSETAGYMNNPEFS